ncbi:hypothetical protein NSS91_18775 [Caldifermentibacillus hisashii]|uniref:hypothetical protein n=1 Tax=Caldifermentibacillus hisashii TaxID=996558 RepID=UPI0031FD003F
METNKLVKPFLVDFLRRKNHFFDDEIHSRHHFWAENSIFWRRDLLSSAFLCGKLHFLATTPFLVDFLRREMPFFGDEIHSRHHFGAKNSTFWRRDLLSSAFWGGKLYFLATRPFLVGILRRKNHFFDDEIHSRHHFGAKNSIFWRRDPFSSTFLRGKLHFLATTPVLVDFFAWETPLFGDETPFRRHFEAEKSLF